ncbi:tyrosine-protein phosphatase non-receptor type 23 isoform X2 [Bombyx mori]|uniref:Tyrosine-protein phosphatase non-receptor type 23 n=1 Tax=Bombyx mori TaxID=7091 RepID=A0A8R2LU87_BOMMO|nr:tyrosine-protein phosphatase non-receptor type 23 isoform X2 [Bombyx mori]
MEAVPKIPLISFELKVSTENTKFGTKLKQYIAEVYKEDPESYSNEIHSLEGLRSAAVRPTMDTAGLKSLIRYFCQLRAMQSRFPMSKGQPAACNFTWKDLYASMNCTSASARFELGCILYNIGALNTELGAMEPRTTAESLKATCTHFQHAAYSFQLLREQFTQPPGVDISSEIMRLLQEICLGQAQQCILEKSIQDTRKPRVIGAVAIQVVLFCKNALALLGPSTGSENVYEVVGITLYNYWYRSLSFKMSFVGSIACLYQGMHAEEQQKMGERVAFYQLAAEKLAEARKIAKNMDSNKVILEALNFMNDVIEGKKKAAKNENEFIYHEEVPDKDMLTELKPVCLVKPLPINFNDPELSGSDLFARLVPIAAHEVSSVYSEQKAKLLRHVMTQIDAKNTELTEFMSSLQLDQLDVLDSEQKVPQDIVDRCAAMNAKSEIIQSLVDSMNSLAETISDVEHSLGEIKNLIQEETMKEKEFQKLMGPRPPSIVQTELSREYHKYQEAHTRTNESNQVLHKAMTLHIANLKLLAQPLDVLQEKIPSIDNIGLDRETMSEMRRVVGKAREMQAQRDALVQQLRDAVAADDVTALLLVTNEPPEDLFKREIEKHAPTVKILEQNLGAQENIINKLTSLYASYGDSRRLLSEVLRKRDGLINALVTSYDTYEELLGKSQKGQEFYKKLSHNVNQLLSRLKSTCQVQEEERAQLLSKQNTKAVTSAPGPAVPAAAAPKVPDVAGLPPTGAPRKLKDYLPYMKNRSNPRNTAPPVQMEAFPPDTYYPETMYLPSVRPAPVGSEATDVAQMQLPDGVLMSQAQNTSFTDRYNPNVMPETSYAQNYAYPAAEKPYDKDNSAYNPHTQQYPPQIPDPQQVYTGPYYSTPQNSAASVSEPQSVQYSNQPPNMNTNPNIQYPVYNDPYAQNVQSVASSHGSNTYASANQAYANNQTDLNVNFAQMHINAPKSEPSVDPSHGYYMQYPQSSTPSVAYNAGLNTGVPAPGSQLPTDYSSLSYQYSTESVQYSVSAPYSVPEQPYSYVTSSLDSASQHYATQTIATGANTSTTNVTSTVTSLPYTYPPEAEVYNPALAQMDAFDKPIKSHVTGEALSSSFQSNYNTQNYSNIQNYQNPNVQSYQPTSTYEDQSKVNYGQTYQNHPGYTLNQATGNYEYNYGSQNSYANHQGNVDPQTVHNDSNWAGQRYTSAGGCHTVQSPSETQVPQAPTQEQNSNQYYNAPYGYITTTNQSNEMVATPQTIGTNYGANVNQSTYMQSGQGHDTSVTFTSNQVFSQKENDVQSTEQNGVSTESRDTMEALQAPQSNDVSVQETVPTPVQTTEQVAENPIEEIEPKPEISVFDLLSDIDFTVEQKPLMPEIKVPQISESAIRKQVLPKPEPAKAPKEEALVRPAKRDIFSDPSLLNQFTQEVKNLQRLVDSLTNRTPSGLTLLDSKWKMYQDVQLKENMTRSKTIAMKHSRGNIVTEVVPFDDSRLTLKSDPDAYINASHYKQLASWCIPLVISKNPSEDEYGIFWKSVLENKISCIVCLLSEIELQGKSYWPTAKGQSLELYGLKVLLEEVNCTVHWTERRLRVAGGSSVHAVTHYQINVFPAKIVCSPLVLLVDKILSQTYENRLCNQLCGAWIQCGAGAGRSAVVAVLVMVMCQVRAGQLDLCDMLDAGCVNLYKGRANILEDTKYLADAYRTALFYVQGVLCSGTTNFNGEAVSGPTGASILPPVTPTPNNSNSATPQKKFSRESFEEMKQAPGLKSGDMKDPLNFLDPLWSLKKK